MYCNAFLNYCLYPFTLDGYLILRFAKMLPINICMQLELLDYQYLTNWNLNELTTKFKERHDINPSWPLVATTLSSFSSEANHSVWADFTNGRKRGRPREIRGSTIDSAFTYVAEQLGLKGFVQNVQGACAGSLYAFYNAACTRHIFGSFSRSAAIVGGSACNSSAWRFC